MPGDDELPAQLQSLLDQGIAWARRLATGGGPPTATQGSAQPSAPASTSGTGSTPPDTGSNKDDDPAALGSAWQKAIGTYRTTTKWIVAAFASVLVAAIGTSPFLVLDKVQTPVQVAWTAWGLVAALFGTFIIVYVASEIFTPLTVDSGELLMAEQPIEAITTLTDNLGKWLEAAAVAAGDHQPLHWFPDGTYSGSPDIGWRPYKSIQDAQAWLGALDRQLWRLDQQIYEKLEQPDEGAVARLRAQRDIVQRRKSELYRDTMDAWTDQAAFEKSRMRFRSSRPIMFVAGVLAALGLVAFVGAARLDLLTEDPSATAAPAETAATSGWLQVAPGSPLISLIPASSGSALAGGQANPACDPAQALPVVINEGTGTAADPWRLQGTAESACGPFSITLSSDQGQVLTRNTRPTAFKPRPAMVHVRAQTIRDSVTASSPECPLNQEPTPMQWLQGDGSPASPWVVTGISSGPCPVVTLSLTSDTATVVGTGAPEAAAAAPQSGIFAPAYFRRLLVAWAGLAAVGGLLLLAVVQPPDDAAKKNNRTLISAVTLVAAGVLEIVAPVMGDTFVAALVVVVALALAPAIGLVVGIVAKWRG